MTDTSARPIATRRYRRTQCHRCRQSLPLELRWSLQPLRTCVVEARLEQGRHVARVKWAVRSDREGRRNESEVEIGALARGKQIEPEEVTGRVTLVDGGQRALSNPKEVGLCQLPLGCQFGIGDDVEPVLRRCRVEWFERAQGQLERRYKQLACGPPID